MASGKPVDKYKTEITAHSKNAWMKHNGKVMGMALLGDELFVVCQKPPNIIYKYVISSADGTSRQPPVELGISEMVWPRGLAASENLKCLFVTDWNRLFGGRVWRYRYEKGKDTQSELGPVAKFDVQPFGVSVSAKDDSVLVSCATPINSLVSPRGWIYVFRQSGRDFLKVKVVELDGLQIPRHAVQLKSGRYVVCHGWTRQYDQGVTSYAEGETGQGAVRRQGVVSRGGGSRPEEMDRPLSMAVDEDGSILVVDYTNQRIHLLKDDLNWIRHLVTKDGHGMEHPRNVCLHPKTGQMFVGLEDGTVCIFQARQPPV